MKVEVKLNKSNSNPFYGLRNCLSLMQRAGGTTTAITETFLDSCWDEVKDNKEHRQMFFSLLFSVGDITARQHNIFKGVKKDSGGNANREGFYVIFNWLKKNHKDQFIVFLNKGLFNEYTCFDLLFRSRVQTKGSKVLQVYDIFADTWYRDKLADYVYSVINGTNPFNKMLVAKFLTIPRLSKRAGHKQMLPETRTVMEHKTAFLIQLSKMMKWNYSVEGNYANFEGYRKWRSQYNGSLESVLFSTGKIREFDKAQFIDWLDKLPAQARFRVRNRLLYSKNADETQKWPKLESWYTEWEEVKETKQAEQRVLEEKVRQGQASLEDVEKLEKVKKEAKVNVGATSFNELYDQIMTGKVDTLKLEAFIQNKVNLPYNSLVIIDDSGSMMGRPFAFASFLAAVCLIKNPDDDGRNLLGFFGQDTRFYSYIDKEASETPNMLMRSQAATSVHKPFVDPQKSFLENYKRIHNFCRATFEGGWTDISSLISSIKSALKRAPQLVDALKAYPVWTIISDGEWNNMPSPEASVNDLLRNCESVLGFKPYIVAIDVTRNDYVHAERFSGIDNLMYIPSNPGQIEQFLTNFKDMDVFDVYTPLQSIYRSNRYELIRESTL